MVAAIAVSAIIFLWVLQAGLQIFMVAFAGILLAITLRRLAGLVGRLPRMSDDLGLVIVLAFGVAILAIGGHLMAPRIAFQVDELIDRVPRSLDSLERYMSRYAWSRALLDQARTADELLPTGELVARATGLFSAGLGWLVNGVIMLFVGLFAAAQPRLYVDATVRLVPPARRERAGEVLSALETTLWRWIIGRLAGMAVIGILTTVGLLVLGVPLAITLGVISALLSFIPYLGPILAGLFVGLMALTVSPTLLLYTLILYGGVQVVESYLLSPLIDRHAVLLPPALTIIAQVLLSILLGAMGLLLASPLVAMVMVLVKMLYLEDFLGESISLPGRGKDDDDG